MKPFEVVYLNHYFEVMIDVVFARANGTLRFPSRKRRVWEVESAKSVVNERFNKKMDVEMFLFVVDAMDSGNIGSDKQMIKIQRGQLCSHANAGELLILSCQDQLEKAMVSKSWILKLKYPI